MEISQVVKEWVQSLGINNLEPYDPGDVAWALNLGRAVSSLEPHLLDEAILILANFKLYVAHQMGLTYARLRYLESHNKGDLIDVERAKFLIVKPFHDALDAKISVMKKIYDRRIREAK